MNINQFSVLLALSLLISNIAISGECDNPESSEEIAQCIGIELRAADAQINASYQKLMGMLDKNDRLKLRLSQRAWIKARDQICGLDTSETDRERWYRKLLLDYPKTVCVTKFTRQRTKELESMLDQNSPRSSLALGRPTVSHSAPHIAAPAGRTVMPPSTVPYPLENQEKAYDGGKPTIHSSGKWYYELTVNYAAVVNIEPVVLYAGTKGNNQLVGIMDNIRERDAIRGDMIYGFAIDLDNGKLYVSKNGIWTDGEPGSNRGSDLKLGRDYYAAFGISANDDERYIQEKAIVPNFGDFPMHFSLPAGYLPWRNHVATTQPRVEDKITSIPEKGYKASYFNGDRLIASEIVDSISIKYPWSDFKGIPSPNFHATWERRISVDSDKTLVLSTDVSWSDVLIFIDGKCLSSWRNDSKEVPITLSKGTHTFKLEYYNHWHTVGFNASFDNYPKLTLSDASQRIKQLAPGKVRTIYIGAYESKNRYNDVVVKINHSKYPVVLFMASYEAINWKIENPYHVPVKSVLIGGYSPGSSVSISGNKTKIFKLQELPYVYEHNFAKPSEIIEQITGVVPSYTYGEYGLSQIEVPDL